MLGEKTIRAKVKLVMPAVMKSVATHAVAIQSKSHRLIALAKP